MQINELFDITLARVLFYKDTITGYDITLYSDKIDDFEMMRIHVDTRPPHTLYIENYDLADFTLEHIRQYYPFMAQFLDELLIYVQQELLK